MTPRPVYKTLHVPRRRCGIDESVFWGVVGLALLVLNLGQSPGLGFLTFLVGYAAGFAVRQERGLVPIWWTALRAPRYYDAGWHTPTIIAVIPKAEA